MFIPPIIADTNIFVAAGFNGNSSSRHLIDALDTGRLIQVWNENTRRETVAVVDRIPPLDGGFMASLFRKEGYYSAPTSPDNFAVIDDESDRKFAALAHACGTILITNDNDFLEVRHALDIVVMRPATFLEGRLN